jgi:response regulator RpfG family c-di-GMP phosphodiesterase
MSNNTEINPICIIAENDQMVTKTLVELIEKFFPKLKLIKANDGKTALSYYEKVKQYPVVIISELRLPALDGRQFMTYTRRVAKGPLYTIAMTDEISQRGSMELLQSGVDDILTKPLEPGSIISKMRIAIKQILMAKKIQDFPDAESLKVQAKKEMSLDVSNLLDSFIEKKGIKLPDEKKKFFEEATKFIFEKQEGKYEELVATLNAMKFLNGYKLYLDDSKIQSPVMKNGYPSQAAMEEYPKFVQKIFSYLSGLDSEFEILYHIYENVDGTGMPDKKRYWHIPLGSRILRILIEYSEALKESKDDQHKAIESVFNGVKRLYDHTCLVHLDQYLALNQQDPGTPEEIIQKNQLRENFVCSRNIISKDGLMLMSRKTKLDKEQIQTLWNKIEKEGMIGEIFIYSDSKGENKEK